MIVNIFNYSQLIFPRHIFLIGKYKCWGPYELIWELRMDDLMAVPTVQDDKLIFSFKQVNIYF